MGAAMLEVLLDLKVLSRTDISNTTACQVDKVNLALSWQCHRSTESFEDIVEPQNLRIERDLSITTLPIWILSPNVGGKAFL